MVQRVSTAAALCGLLGLAACGQHDSKKTSTTGLARSTVIPAGFASTAASDAEVAAHLTALTTPLMDAAHQHLGLASAADAAATGMAGGTTALASGLGLADTGLPSATIDTSTLAKTYATGADCAPLLKAFETGLAAVQGALGRVPGADAAASATTPPAGVAVGTSPATTPEVAGAYATTDLGKPADARFSYHKQLTRQPVAGGAHDIAGFFSMLLPNLIDIAGGATDTEAAMQLGMNWTLDFPADPNGGQTATTMTMRVDSEMYVSQTSESLQYSLLTTMDVDAGEVTTAVQATAVTTVQGGATPSVAVVADSIGAAGDQSRAAHAEYRIAKAVDAPDGVYEITIKVDADKLHVDEQLSLKKTGSQCAVL